MAKLHRSYRLEEDVVEQVATWARENGRTTTQAMEELLRRGLATREEETDAEGLRQEVERLRAREEALRIQRDVMADNLKDLRETRATLTAQLGVKDGQIARLQDAVDHAQVLEAAHVAGNLTSGADVSQGEIQASTSIWARIARKFRG